ncbi:MAG TPA: 5-dehydro-2-deoxygluconokinase [Marinobacterium sp.]|nr:5-dehydro-2-deoxygluconokinase [Marinobacterium sp.]
MLAFAADKPFLVVGRAGMDLYADPVGARTEDAAQFVTALGGSSANIAVALSKFGKPCALVTCVSDDAIGRFVTNQLRHYGVDASKVRKINSDCRTSLAVVESRVEDHQSVIYRNNAADFQMDQGDVESIDYSAYCGLIVTGTCLTLEPSRSATLLALRKAREAGIPCVMDLDYRPYSWESAGAAKQVYEAALDQLDVIVGNDDEFGHMAGEYEDGESYARALSARGKYAIYKRGEKGSRTFGPNELVIDTGIFQVTPLKPTGAGDSFLGGLLASLCRGNSLQQALLDGSACAAMVVSRVGCAPAMPDLKQLESFMEQTDTPEQVLGV